MTVEARDIPVDELATFDEVLAVGTAVVVTPVGSVTRFDDQGEETRYDFSEDVGEVTRSLYDKVRAIQNGEEDDQYGWNFSLEK